MKTQRLLFFVLALFAWLPLAAHAAGGSARLNAEQETMSISWLNDDVRMEQSGETGHMLIKNGKAYAVMQEGGQAIVLELSSMAQMMKQMHPSEDADQLFSEEVQSVKPTGKKETVAGISGKVYEVTTKDAKGAVETHELVLTDNKLVNELTQKYVLVAMALLDENENMQEYMDALPRKERGILRAGDHYRLESISDETPAKELFDMPANPMNLQDMFTPENMQKMQQLMNGS